MTMMARRVVAHPARVVSAVALAIGPLAKVVVAEDSATGPPVKAGAVAALAIGLHARAGAVAALATARHVGAAAGAGLANVRAVTTQTAGRGAEVPPASRVLPKMGNVRAVRGTMSEGRARSATVIAAARPRRWANTASGKNAPNS